MIINRLKNMFRNKEWSEAWKYKKSGVRKDEYDGKDYIFEEIYNIPTPPKNKKCNYYLGRENVDNDRAFIVKDDKGKEFLDYFNKLPKASDINKGDTTNKVNKEK